MNILSNMKKLNFKFKKFNLILIFFYFLSLLYIKEMLFLFYNSTDSPDFLRYFKFLEFNVNILDSTQSEHGFLYYDLQSFYFYFKNFGLNNENFFIYLSRSIQELHFILFLIGSIGTYFLLSIYKFNNLQILTSLTLINFLPIGVAQRIIFKPEIIVFAFFPWLVVLLETYITTKKFKYLYGSIPLIIGMFSQKGSIFVMVCLFLLIFYFRKIYIKLLKNNRNHFMLFSFILITSFFLVYSENTRLNNQSLLETEYHQYESKYDNKGDLSLIYKINLEELIFYPYKHLHSESAIHITLLDSFGDYFDLYWENDSSNFFKSRNDFFVFETSDNLRAPFYNSDNKELKIYVQDEDHNYNIRKTFSLITAILFFYLFFLYFIRTEKRKKRFFILPFLGYVVILIHVISGFPENNFDPLIGDTLKPIYYSFFIIFAFSFCIAEMTKNSLRSFFILAILIPIFLYIYGFPKNYLPKDLELLNETNSYSSLCKINRFVFNIALDSDSENLCELNNPSNFNNYDDYINFKKRPNFHPINSLIILLSAFVIVSTIKDRLRAWLRIYQI